MMLQARPAEEIAQRFWDRVHRWREHVGGRGKIKRCDYFFSGMYYSFLNPWGDDIAGLSTLAFYTERPRLGGFHHRSSNPTVAWIPSWGISGPDSVTSIAIETMAEGTAKLTLFGQDDDDRPCIGADIVIEVKARPEVPEFEKSIENPWGPSAGPKPRREMIDWPFCVPAKKNEH